LSQFEQLASRDPTNQDLRLVIASTRTRLGICLIGLGRSGESLTLLREARAALYPGGSPDKASAQAKLPLATACRWLSTAERISGHPVAALAAADESVAMLRQILVQNRGNVNAQAEAASALVASGMIAQSTDSTKAIQMSNEAIDVLGLMVSDSSYWRLLDPALRACIVLGRTEQARSIATRLNHYGYRPIDPWPAEVSLKVSSVPH
jgi:hypothetical protein